jgi:hypothetical protein
MENNAWYKEKWATDLMGIIAGEVFKAPVEAPIVSPQQPAVGAEPGLGGYAPVVMIISVVALILLFLFLRR